MGRLGLSEDLNNLQFPVTKTKSSELIIAPEVKYETPVADIIELIKAKNDADLPKLIEKIALFFEDRDYEYWSRSYNEILTEIQLIAEVDQTNQYLSKLHNNLALANHSVTAEMANFISNLDNRKFESPESHLRIKIERFFDNRKRNPEEVVRIANEIDHLIDKVSEYSKNYLKNLSWYNPNVNKFGNHLNANWETVYSLSLQDSTGIIKKVLFKLGVNDPRLKSDYKLIAKEIGWKFHDRTKYTNLTMEEQNGIIFDEAGPKLPIIFPKNRFKNIFSIEDNHDYFTEEKSKLDRESLEACDWSQLRSDPAKFLQKYQTRLCPDFSIKESPCDFERAFIDELEKILIKDPHLAIRIIEQFFSAEGVLDQAIDKFKTYHACTLPSLYIIPHSKLDRGYNYSDNQSKYNYVQIGILPSHPYYSFAQKHLELFNMEQKVLVHGLLAGNLSGHPITHSNILQIAQLNATNFCVSMKAYEKPKNIEELFMLTKELGQIKLFSNIELAQHVKGVVVKDFLFDNNLPYFELNNELLNNTYKKISLTLIGQELHHEIVNQIKRNIIVYKSDEFSADYLINELIKLDELKILVNQPQLLHDYTEIILSKLEKVVNSEKKLNQLEALIKHGNLEEPTLKRAVFECWSEVVLACYGTDTRSSDFKTAADELLMRLFMQQSSVFTLELSIIFLQRTNAQEEVNLSFKKQLQNKYGNQLFSSDFIAQAIGVALGSLDKESNDRKSILSFLCSELSTKSVYLMSGSIKSNLLISFLQLRSDSAQESIDFRLSSFHKSFWSYPFELRTVFLSRLLFPVAELTKTDMAEEFEYVLNKVFPNSDNYSQTGKQIALYFIKEYPFESQRLLLSALIASTPGKEGQTLRPGQVLSEVFSKFPGAGGRVLQALHSYLNSLDNKDAFSLELIKDLEQSKQEYNQLLPWEVFERLRAILPPDLYSEIAKEIIGPACGSGVYSQTIKCIYQKEVAAISILRENIAAEGEYHFSVFEKVLEQLCKEDSKWDFLRGVLNSAKESHYLDSDFNIRGQQTLAAQELYPQQIIEVDNFRFTFSAIAVHKFGPEYVLSDFAEGTSFNRMVADPNLDPKYLEALAKAHFLVELNVILSGNTFNSDQHGGQNANNDNHIKLLDPGGIDFDQENRQINKPNKEDLRALGKVLGSLIKSQENGDNKDFTSNLIKTISLVTKENPSLARYLGRFQRAILASGDFIGKTGSTVEDRNNFLSTAIQYLIANQKVHPEILNGAKINWFKKLACRIRSIKCGLKIIK